ncbi:chromosomal replication initiator protein DnaA [Desulfuromonas thiophila]|uniref:chromosomal replication initiator protein DnaA n=1 Tax=Desulfuromonas thiophila TaxID=57664 RepID=UPI0029F55D29|nr:chromosomal replication initiator protein DnaA [Desulfuromonas thiophila]
MINYHDSNLWLSILDVLKNSTSEQNFTTWIKPIKFLEFKNNTITLCVKNIFIKNWVDKNYVDLIKTAAFKKHSISDINIKIIVSDKYIDEDKRNYRIDENTIKTKIDTINSYINKEYTFENFISGNSNQFAAAASQAVANNPATVYNPLFIYGGVGLGKTHLLHAIGNCVIQNKKLRAFYYSSEKFTNELINSIRYGKMDEFRNKFRNIDVLLIDDVQFIAGKERTQEEFFHTFNSLYESQKQIVVTSDKFPKEIPGLEERLRSRFEWGLIADIQPPDNETKQAILEAKAEKNKIKLTKEVTDFLVNSVISNIRELEGYIVRLGAYASLTSTEITVEMAKEILKDIIIEKSSIVTIEDIQKKACQHFNIKISDLKSSKRAKKYVVPRQISMYLCRQLTDCSYPEIGEHFGGKDHSTVIHSIKKIEAEMETNQILKNIIRNIKSTLVV